MKRRLSNLDTIFYYKNQVECDFIIQRKSEIVAAIQVCYQLDDPNTQKRELNGLHHITYDSDEQFKNNDITIAIPVWVKYKKEQTRRFAPTNNVP